MGNVSQRQSGDHQLIAGEKPMRSKGFEYENQAKRFLVAKGLKLMHQNYNCKLGEIDLIMRDGDTIVFVEVRYRNTKKFGSALESINARKCSKLIKTAKHFLQTQNYNKFCCRFDAVAFDKTDSGTDISWIVSAFGESSNT